MYNGGYVFSRREKEPEVREIRKTIKVSNGVILTDDMSAIIVQFEEQYCRLLVEISSKNGKPISIISRDVLESVNKNKRYELKKVCENELKKLRKTHAPALIIKMNGVCYWGELDSSCERLDFMNRFKLGYMHYCATAGKECARLSAASDECGGCAKVRDRGNAKRIEKYPWITDGYQTVNIRIPVFFVSRCNHYVLATPGRFLPKEKINEMKLGIAQYMYPEISESPLRIPTKGSNRGVTFPTASEYTLKNAHRR